MSRRILCILKNQEKQSTANMKKLLTLNDYGVHLMTLDEQTAQMVNMPCRPKNQSHKTKNASQETACSWSSAINRISTYACMLVVISSFVIDEGYGGTHRRYHAASYIVHRSCGWNVGKKFHRTIVQWTKKLSVSY